MAMSMVKLLITGLSTAIGYASVVVFKGAAVLVVLLLRLVQLPGCVGCLLLGAVRAGVEEAVAAALAAAVDALWLAADAAAGAWREALSSNATAAAAAVVQAARGRPEALIAAAGEVAAFALEVARQTASNSTATFLDAALFVVRHARA